MTQAPALLIIDVQKAIDDARWALHGPRNNPAAERNIALLLDAWRKRSWPIYHVRHNSVEPDSPYRPGQPGNEFKPEAQPLPGESVIVKSTNSAFIGTDLETRLRAAGGLTVVVCGVLTNNSVEATARMAGNLGFKTYVAEDACFTFARPDWDGRLRAAEEVHSMSLSNLQGEYASVLRTGQILNWATPTAGSRAGSE